MCSMCWRAQAWKLSFALLTHTALMMPGGALLAALVAGDSAEDFEREDPKESARKVLRVLRGMYAAQEGQRPGAPAGARLIPLSP